MRDLCPFIRAVLRFFQSSRRCTESGRDKRMSLGIYISVPFCRSKCTYCNFASGVFSAAQMGRYVERLCDDIVSSRAMAAHHGAIVAGSVDSVYLGGGTPSLLPPAELTRLFDA